MSFEVWQHPDAELNYSAEGDKQGKTHWRVVGSGDEAAAMAAALAELPSTLDGAALKSVRLESATEDGWMVEADYSNDDEFSGGDEPELSFDTSGGTAKITNSIDTVLSYGLGVAAPDNKGAIGVTENGVEGCDIVVPQFKLSIARQFPADAVTNAYIATLMRLTGRTNDAPFYGMAAGEALFLGAKGSKRGVGPWKMAFDFAGSENRTGLVVGEIGGVAKKGHEYLWIRYVEQTAGDAYIRKPKAVYIEQVYHSGNFAALGVGTG